MPTRVNLLQAYIVHMGNLRDRRTVEPLDMTASSFFASPHATAFPAGA